MVLFRQAVAELGNLEVVGGEAAECENRVLPLGPQSRNSWNTSVFMQLVRLWTSELLQQSSSGLMGCL